MDDWGNIKRGKPLAGENAIERIEAEVDAAMASEASERYGLHIFRSMREVVEMGSVPHRPAIIPHVVDHYCGSAGELIIEQQSSGPRMKTIVAPGEWLSANPVTPDVED